MQESGPRGLPDPDPATAEAPEAPPETGPSSAVEAPAPRVEASPVEPASRVLAVDVLRGIAVCGILLMNIYAYAYPEVGYINPLAIGGATGANFWTWVFTHVFVEGKFVSIFSMLFGAGLVLQSERVGPRVPSFRALYFRRLFWLAIIGAVHGYVLWWGDILFTYAFCALLVYGFRNRSPRWLFIASGVALTIATLLQMATGALYGVMREMAQSGASADSFTGQLGAGWREVEALLAPTPEDLAESLEIYRDGYLGIVVDRAPLVFNSQFVSSPFMMSWRIGGIMLAGMALLKTGVLSAARSTAFYRRLALAGYLVGFPLVLIGLRVRFASEFDVVTKFQRATPLDIVGAPLVALGHIAVTMLLIRAGAMRRLQVRLAALGRMALTNYLMHSVIGTTLFYGYGLGLFGSVDRFALMGIVVAIWALQLAYSPYWLERFRFGPAEWLWRSLTYRRRQPMRKAITSRAAAA